MTSSKRSTAISRLAGRWEQDDGDSDVVYEVAMKAGEPVVTGFDKRDGERFKISDVKWDGKGLSFTDLTGTFLVPPPLAF